MELKEEKRRTNHRNQERKKKKQNQRNIKGKNIKKEHGKKITENY